MASIFDIPLQETGGPDAITAFEYQHRIAVRQLLQMTRSENYDFVEFDSHDDIMVRLRIGEITVAEFIQVKADSKGLWTPSDISSSKNGRSKGEAVQKDKKKKVRSTSIVAKQLYRAIGDDEVRFRVVTKSAVNPDLAILTKPLDARDTDKMSALTDKLASKIKDDEFPHNRTIADWVRVVQWEVSGTAEAVDAINQNDINQAAFTICHRTLSPEDSKGLYKELLARVRVAAGIKEPRSNKRCSRPELVEWLKEWCSKLPIYLPPPLLIKLQNLEREALQRCASRWENAGLRREKAQILSSDETFGAESTQWIKRQLAEAENFLWISASFGSGKSLACDRFFVQLLKAFRAGQDNHIPVFLEAKNMNRPLGEEIGMMASELGEWRTHGVIVIIDGADELTHQKARELVQVAETYARAHPGSKVVITSSILQVPGKTPKLLPPLTESEVDALVKILSDEGNHFSHKLNARFHQDLKQPFFLIQSLRFGLGLSRADLIRRMVDEAFRRIEGPVNDAETILIKLAVWQLDNGTSLIPKASLKITRAEETSLIQTRLIERRGGHLTFTIECVVHSLAAQAIENGSVTISDLLSDFDRLDRWQFAIAMALIVLGKEKSDELMESLASEQPAFASLVLNDAIRDWGFDQETQNLEALEVAHSMRKAMQAWKKGLEPLSSLPAFFPLNDSGELLKVAASSENGRHNIHWHYYPDLPEVAAYPDEKLPLSKGSRLWMSMNIDHPAWAWKTTHGHVKTGLAEFIRDEWLSASHELLLKESAWVEGCWVLGQSAIRSDRLSLSELKKHTATHFPFTARTQLLLEYVEMQTSRGIEYIEAPYPQSDSELVTHWMWEYFSHERMTARAIAVFEVAITAYKDICERFFPKMFHRFPRYAAMPFSLSGVVSFHQWRDSSGYLLTKEMISLPVGSNSSISFKMGTSDESEELWNRWMKFERTTNPHRPSWHLQSCGQTSLDTWSDSPAKKIVHDWIESDLKHLGWG